MRIHPEYIQRLFFFEYEFYEAKSLEEIRERLKGKYQFILPAYLVNSYEEIRNMLTAKRTISLPSIHFPKDIKKNVIATRSLAVIPTMVYYLLLKTKKNGGYIVLFETEKSWYHHNQIIRMCIGVYCKNAGIKCRNIPMKYL